MKVKLLPLELMCSKCHWIMNNPVKSGCCDTRYCLDCFRSPGKSCQCANNNHGQDYFPLESLKNAVQMAKSEMQRNAVCFVCDSIGDHQTKFCPKIECVHCGENRHIELVCPRKRPSPVMQNDDAKKIKLESDPRIEPKLQGEWKLSFIHKGNPVVMAAKITPQSPYATGYNGYIRLVTAGPMLAFISRVYCIRDVTIAGEYYLEFGMVLLRI